MPQPPSIPGPDAESGANDFRVTNRLVLSIALPMMLAYLTTPLLGLTGTAVIGQFGDPALLGGLAAGAIVFDLVFSTFNFLRSGTTGLVAQAFGRGDPSEEQAHFWRAWGLAVAVGLALAALSPQVADAGAWFMGGEPEVLEAMRTYVLIRLLCAPVALANYAILGYLLGRGEARLSLALQLLLNGVNIAMSVWLGLVLGHAVAGVAWGAVIGETIAFLVGTGFLVRRFARQPPVRFRDLFALEPVLRTLALNRDIMIRSFLLLGAFALFTRAGAQLGTLVLAANAVLMNFFLVAGYFLDGFATAAEQLTGRSIGARQRSALHEAIRRTSVWGFGTAALASLALLLGGESVIAVITTSPEVRAAATDYLPWAALTALTGVLAFQMDGIYIGATWSSAMRNMMLLSFALFLAALLLLPPILGNHGLWLALHVFLIARGVSLATLLPWKVRQVFP